MSVTVTEWGENDGGVLTSDWCDEGVSSGGGIKIDNECDGRTSLPLVSRRKNGSRCGMPMLVGAELRRQCIRVPDVAIVSGDDDMVDSGGEEEIEICDPETFSEWNSDMPLSVTSIVFATFVMLARFAVSKCDVAGDRAEYDKCGGGCAREGICVDFLSVPLLIFGPRAWMWPMSPIFGPLLFPLFPL